MSEDFEPEILQADITKKDKQLLNRLIHAQKAQGDMKELKTQPCQVGCPYKIHS